MAKIDLVVCASLLLLNIAVGITVICLVVSRKHDTQISNTENLKQEISKIYEGLKITNGHDDDGDHEQKGARQPSSSAAFLNLLKPVAHFPGLEFRGLNGTTRNDTPIRTWVPFVGPGRRLLYNGMRYENGSIIIPATGVYAVYSHVKFYTERNRRGDNETDFHHSIMRYNALKHTNKTALADAVSENKNDIIDGASLEYSSDIDGLLQLNAGDQLVVKVSKIKPLRHDRDWHYFGVYMI
ncbi:tumor necrosis factor-like [Haliotis rufescens]|uniref:tumor necrosis factor-like n=1 Tax=Haliotis rufescens TaxID=6454 RepID=UPI00201FB061|nr:tumor necrosis factor-like [Haliotis rufescens]XP_046345283.2 tumor necrosis factor-like [Haliotis rufescens]